MAAEERFALAFIGLVGVKSSPVGPTDTNFFAVDLKLRLNIVGTRGIRHIPLIALHPIVCLPLRRVAPYL